MHLGRVTNTGLHIYLLRPSYPFLFVKVSKWEYHFGIEN